MGLSRVNQVTGDGAKETVGLLKEIAYLISNPEEAKKSLTQIIALADTELAKVDVAKAFIAQHASLSDDLRKQKADAAALIDNAHKIAAENEAHKASNVKKETELVLRERELEKLAAFHKEKAAELKKESIDLTKAHTAVEERANSLNELQKTLDEKHQAIKTHEDDLRNRAKRLKAEAESF